MILPLGRPRRWHLTRHSPDGRLVEAKSDPISVCRQDGRAGCEPGKVYRTPGRGGINTPPTSYMGPVDQPYLALPVTTEPMEAWSAPRVRTRTIEPRTNHDTRTWTPPAADRTADPTHLVNLRRCCGGQIVDRHRRSGSRKECGRAQSSRSDCSFKRHGFLHVCVNLPSKFRTPPVVSALAPRIIKSMKGK